MASRIGLALWFVLAMPSVRSMMESDMALHMLLQFPLLLLAGWLLAKGLPVQTRAGLQRWNHAGIAGLLMASMILMFWMIPRALDMVLVERTMEFWKFLTLLPAGAALELSWQAAGMIVRGFFLGNVLPMMMVVGWLYVEAPVRICNAYLTSDQLRAGSGLLAMAIAGCAVWLLAFFMSADGEDCGTVLPEVIEDASNFIKFMRRRCRCRTLMKRDIWPIPPHGPRSWPANSPARKTSS